MPVSYTSGSPRRRTGPLGAVLIALALWVQALAPVGALRMMLGAPADLATGILCGHPPDRTEAFAAVDQQNQAAPVCALCQLCRAGLAPPPPPIEPIFARRLRWRAVAWPIPPPVQTTPRSFRSAPARAPPTIA